MSEAFNELLDQLAMLHMGNQGDTMGHVFLEKIIHYKLKDPDTVVRMAAGYHLQHAYLPPHETDRILMFEDNSGVYVHEDGFCTILGKDISDEVHRYELIR